MVTMALTVRELVAYKPPCWVFSCDLSSSRP